MRQALLSNRQSQSAAEPILTSLPAPVRGWNTRDPVNTLRPEYAQVLENWYPTQGEVLLRGGSLDHATGAGASVRTLISFPRPGTTTQLLAATNSGIYNVTAGGAWPAVAQALTDGRFEHVIMTNSAGTNFLWGVNGVETAKMYDGTTWSTPTITGVTTSNLNWCWLFKRRIFAIEKNSMNAWYLPIDSIAGVAAKLPLGGIFKRGGVLLSGAAWTLDGGRGIDDYCVFVTSEGEVAVYQGVNPASATDWSLVGVFFAGRPPSRRCFTDYGGDLALITEMGIIPLSRLVANALLRPSEALTDAIRPTFSDLVRENKSNSGWTILIYPAVNALIVNVPQANSVSVQVVMNIITGAWCSFDSWNAECFTVHEGVLYFGTFAGSVVKAWDGVLTSDNGTDVLGTVLTAGYRFYGARQSQVGMLRPLFSSDGTFELRLGLVADYDVPEITSTIPRGVAPGISVWGTAVWGTAVWGGGLARWKSWYHVSSEPGASIALYLQAASNDATITAWSGTDYQVKRAGWM